MDSLRGAFLRGQLCLRERRKPNAKGEQRRWVSLVIFSTFLLSFPCLQDSEAAPKESNLFPPSPPPSYAPNPYARDPPYNEASNYFFASYLPPVDPVINAVQAGQPYTTPYPYTYNYPQPAGHGGPGAPQQPYITRPYQFYSRDFLYSLESIKELKDLAVRTAFLSLKELAPNHPGSLYGDHELKAVIIWRRSDENWGIQVNGVRVPEGHNPTVHSLARHFLLNASTAASSACYHAWSRLSLKIEARSIKDIDALQPLRHDEVQTSLRHLTELRIIVEDTWVGSGLLILKPISVQQHITDEAHPYADGPVDYSFATPYKTSFSKEIAIPENSNPTMHRLAQLYMQRAVHSMRECSISTRSLIPSFVAIAKDEVGLVRVLPLNNLDIPLRAIGWSEMEGEAAGGKEVSLNLVLYLKNMLKSEAANPCFEGNFRKTFPAVVSEKKHVLPVWVTAHCHGLLIRRCRRREILLQFTNIRTNVRDAMSAIRSHMQVNKHRPLSSPTCFVGRLRLKRRVTRLLNTGKPWKEIPSRTLLIDIMNLKSGVLLAPATGVFTRTTTTARITCSNYISLLHLRKPIYVPHPSYVTPKQNLSAFGPHSINVFE